MQTETQSLESFFQQVVRDTFETKLGFRDAELVNYIARMLCDFSEPGNLYRLQDENGRRLESVKEMVQAADPVNGTAPSFDAERAARKYIGDYALFVAGMCHHILNANSADLVKEPNLGELIAVGKESYHIVSQFNLFEYEHEAPLFARLAEGFEHCLLGLALIREDMGEQLTLGEVEKQE